MRHAGNHLNGLEPASLVARGHTHPQQTLSHYTHPEAPCCGASNEDGSPSRLPSRQFAGPCIASVPRQGLVGLAPGRREVQGSRSTRSQQEQKGLGAAGGRRVSLPSLHVAGVAAPRSVVRGSGEMHVWVCASQTEETRAGQEASKSWDSDQR